MRRYANGRQKDTVESAAGANVSLAETVTAARVTDGHYRLTTFRTVQPRVFGDRALAEEAYAREIIASEKDPVAMQMAAAGP